MRHGFLTGILIIVLLWLAIAFLGGLVVLLAATSVPGVTVSGLGGGVAFGWFLIATFVVVPVLSVLILKRFSGAPERPSSHG